MWALNRHTQDWRGKRKPLCNPQNRGRLSNARKDSKKKRKRGLTEQPTGVGSLAPQKRQRRKKKRNESNQRKGGKIVLAEKNTLSVKVLGMVV